VINLTTTTSKTSLDLSSLERGVYVLSAPEFSGSIRVVVQ